MILLYCAMLHIVKLSFNHETYIFQLKSFTVKMASETFKY